MTSFDIICGDCGNRNVRRDAWAVWDRGRQRWVLGEIFDYGHCNDCEEESRLEELPLIGRGAAPPGPAPEPSSRA